jgi:uncharacterized membrane protein
MINLLEQLDSYNFIKAVLGLLIGGILLGYFYYGYRLLRRDEGQNIGESDMRLYFFAYIQLCLYIFKTSIVELSLLEYSFRILKLVINITVIITFLDYILNEIYAHSIQKAFKFSLSLSVGFLVFMVVDANFARDCGENFWELFDIIYLASTAIIVYLGSKAISEITAIENHSINQPSDPITKQFSLHLIWNQKNNYFIIIMGSLISCLLFVATDFIKFFFVVADKKNFCTFILSGYTLTGKVTFCLFELAGNILPMYTIYYVYVIKNWSLLDVNPRQEVNLSEAYDSLRSHLIVEMEIKTIKQRKLEESKQTIKITFDNN